MTRRAPRTPAEPTTRWCAIYTRKSTSAGLEQEFNSLYAQREACAAYVRARAHDGWQLCPRTYEDGGFTGANTNRPGFQQLLDDVDAGRVQVIVVYKVDRLSRSLLDFSQIMERLNEAGCAFVSVTQNFSTADAMGRLTLNMLMSFAEFEREMIAERTRDKIAASRRRGKWTGGPTPYGFRLVAGRLQLVDDEAEVVREIYRLYEEHRSALAVAQVLNQRGIAGRKRDRDAKHMERQGTWSKDRVLRILRSPVYCGRMPYKGEVHEGEHDGIIDPARWDELQQLLDTNVAVTAAWSQDPDYLLRGLLRCGACGRAMSPNSTRHKGREFRYYRYGTQSDHGRDACTGRPLPAAQVEAYVVQQISAAVADPSLVAEVETATRARLDTERRRLRALERELPGRIAATRTRLAELSAPGSSASAEQSAHRRDDVADLERALTEDESRLAETVGALAELATAEVSAGWLTSVLRDFDRVWDLLTPENRVRLVQSLVDHVVVDAATGSIEIVLADPSSDFPLNRSHAT